MAKLYSQERSKYGNLTGQIIVWPVEINPDISPEICPDIDQMSNYPMILDFHKSQKSQNKHSEKLKNKSQN